jgi:hypothetical protein
MEETVLNIERMLQLADAIESEIMPGLKFSMVDWSFGFHVVGVIPMWCGTSACTAGWACLLFGATGSLICGDNAASYLGLSEVQAERLFQNTDGYVSPTYRLEDITREEAVAAIRRMVAEERGEQIAREIVAAQSEEAEEMIHDVPVATVGR